AKYDCPPNPVMLTQRANYFPSSGIPDNNVVGSTVSDTFAIGAEADAPNRFKRIQPALPPVPDRQSFLRGQIPQFQNFLRRIYFARSKRVSALYHGCHH